jgi:SAM-dependent methyltransferase
VALALTLIATTLNPRQRLFAGMAALGLVIAAGLTSEPLFATVYGQMQSREEWGKPGTRLNDVVETRSGVVIVDQDAAIFGGGVFDGFVVTDIHKTDTVIEPLSFSLIHPDPEEVLEVGMSGGAWSEIIANHPQVRKQTIIEINPGYIQVARRYPAVAPFLKNPKVEVIIDDGRRWMQRHRDRKFDLIVMDTTYHWRAHATNLLSVEFLELARSMLKPGGILFYNATYSWEAQRTGAVRFPYAYRFGLFMAVSDSPIPVDKDRWCQRLLAYTLEGKRIFDPASSNDQQLLARVLAIADTLPGDRYESDGMETRDNILRRTAGRRIVTDDNMATEWGDYDWRR